MDEFWDVDTSTAPRVVDVYMAKLWDELSACDDFEIVTVRGLPSICSTSQKGGGKNWPLKLCGWRMN
jgi:hypothetical protein